MAIKSYMANVESKMTETIPLETLPHKPKKTIKNLIEIPKAEYNISEGNIYEHDDISPQEKQFQDLR